MTDPRIEELRRLLPRCMLYDWVRLGARTARLLRDQHHSDRHDAVLERLLERARASVALREWRESHRPEVSYPPDLPIVSRRDEILEALRTRQVVVIAGETGSGKTTQIPKMCLEAGLGISGKIGCTQPRRVAALSISRRIAEELNVAWGREVGSKIRFDDRSSPETFIKLMTDGILLAEVQGDPSLSEYGAIVLDEAHERSLNVDFLLGHLKGLLARREDLKLVITSATLDTAAFSRAFGDAPVIEVSGRMYPVEVRHAPVDGAEEERGDSTYVDAGARACETVLAESPAGDVLIFMPGERDIRECADQIEAAAGDAAEVIPLYGRLSAGDQQRVFSPGPRRRVIVSTNIAETSLTLPRIRYVIDSGLARISRYNPRTRTRRLPIEPISQSSANQRKGRAGRIQEGVCIRLYSEEDYNERPPFTQPEIQRSNLAEVILRMKAFHLGEIETFPFLNPPSPAAIHAGYQLLHELGALDEKRELTPLGRDLARLPIDPTLGRMLLQAQREHAVRELLIIASGLSIQDPRERPMDQQAAADAAHRRHVHPKSDFLTLLNLWGAVHDEWESLRTQSQRRKFCRKHFLSYVRMREWQDLYAQLLDALEDLGSVRVSESNAEYAAVHRSILTGLLAHVARRQERNLYEAAGKRRVMLFPGSTLFARQERTAGQAKATAKVHQPEWIVAGEIVETTQVYARTVAGIDPAWIAELAPHLCRVTHAHPHWSATAGRVLVQEVTWFSGLEVRRRKVAYGNVDAADATRLFIRQALVEEGLVGAAEPEDDDDAGAARRGAGRPDERARVRRLGWNDNTPPPVPAHYRFLEHNRRIREAIEDWQTRVRRPDMGDAGEALFRFYARHLENVSSRDELNRWLREPGRGDLLCAREEELTGGRSLAFDAEAFPDSVMVGGQPVPVRYAYAPGEEHDGVTVRVPFTLADAVPAAALEWAVPGLRESRAEELLRALPRSLRAQLQPIAPKAAEIAREFEPTGSSFLGDLARFLHRRYGVTVPHGVWTDAGLPAHLRTRVEVVGPDQKPLAASRDLQSLKQHLASVPAPVVPETEAWTRAERPWEHHDVRGWTFGDLPERVTVSEGRGGAVYGWPGLEVEGGLVHVRLHRTQAASREGTRRGMERLVEIALGKDLAWARKDLRGLQRWAGPYAPLGSFEELEESAYRLLMREVMPPMPGPPYTAAAFQEVVGKARARLTGVSGRIVASAGAILELREQVARRLGPAPAASPAVTKPSAGVRVFRDFSQLASLPAGPVKAATPASAPGSGVLTLADLNTLLPPRFLELIPSDRLVHVPRYLKAMLVRLDRAQSNPPKDRERAALLAPYVDALRRLRAEAGGGSEARRAAIEAFRWMVEEYRVSLFAQELGTATPVSPKRLQEQLETLKGMA